MFRIYINTTSAPYVTSRRHIPFLDMVSRCSIIKICATQIGLLYGKHFHSRAVRVNIGYVKTVTMPYGRAHHKSFSWIDSITTLHYFIYTVTVNIGNTELVKFCGRRIG